MNSDLDAHILRTFRQLVDELVANAAAGLITTRAVMLLDVAQRLLTKVESDARQGD